MRLSLSRRRHRLLYIVTHAMTARHLLRGQLSWMGRQGFEVGVASAPGADLEVVRSREGARIYPVPMSRGIDPVGDLRALMRLLEVMRDWRPDIVNASTPKAGLLGMVASRISRVPVRIYTLRGLRMETSRGVRRAILTRAERVAAASADEILAVSPSLAARYVALGLAPDEKVHVLGPGSSNGVEWDRFARPDVGIVTELRDRLGLSTRDPVIGFVGRFTRDKGVVELVEAFDRVREEMPGARLLMVGDFEREDPVPAEVETRIRRDPAIVWPGFAPDSAPYYSLMDVLSFPSHREGLPNAPLEAAAAGLPVVGYRATGTVDVIVHGETGALVEKGDPKALALQLLWYLGNPTLRKRHGAAGRERARRDFQPEAIWRNLLTEYDRLLSAAGRTCAKVMN